MYETKIQLLNNGSLCLTGLGLGFELRVSSIRIVHSSSDRQPPLKHTMYETKRQLLINGSLCLTGLGLGFGGLALFVSYTAVTVNHFCRVSSKPASCMVCVVLPTFERFFCCSVVCLFVWRKSSVHQLFDAFVEAHYVRDEATTAANQWFVVSDWTGFGLALFVSCTVCDRQPHSSVG